MDIFGTILDSNLYEYYIYILYGSVAILVKIWGILGKMGKIKEGLDSS